MTLIRSIVVLALSLFLRVQLLLRLTVFILVPACPVRTDVVAVYLVLLVRLIINWVQTLNAFEELHDLDGLSVLRAQSLLANKLNIHVLAVLKSIDELHSLAIADFILHLLVDVWVHLGFESKCNFKTKSGTQMARWSSQISQVRVSCIAKLLKCLQ